MINPDRTLPTVLALCASTALVYAFGLHGPFMFDDYQNLVLPLERGVTSLRGLWEYISDGVSGPLGRPLALLSFAANAWALGLEPFWFKVVNLAIHLVNGALVFGLVRRLVQALAQPGQGPASSALLPGFVTAAWLLHPLQVSSVLYVVQRMTSLSATFCLLGLHAYLVAREQQQAAIARPARSWLWGVTPLCLLLAMFTKESGVLLIAYVFVIELCLLQFRARAGLADLRLFHALFLGVPLAVAAVFLAPHPGWLAENAALRGFNVTERLLTEARALWFYLQLLVVPDPGLMSLFHDDFPISRGWLTPWSTMPAVAGWVAAIGAVLLLRRRLPWLAFGIGWFLAGHALESTVVMLEPVQLHRNYLAILGPLLAAGVAVSRLSPAWQRRALLVAGLWIACLATGTALRAHQWCDVFAVAFDEEMHHPDSARMNYEVGRLLSEAARKSPTQEGQQESERYFWRAAELNPRDVTALIALVTVGEAPTAKRAYAVLRERLASRPLAATDLPALMQLAKCNAMKLCEVPSEHVFGVFDAALGRPQSPAMHAEALSLLAIYHLNPRRDLATTVRLLEDAAALQPDNPVRHLDLANVRLLMRDADGAASALDKADAADRWQHVQIRSQRLRADLARLRAETAAAPPAAG